MENKRKSDRYRFLKYAITVLVGILIALLSFLGGESKTDVKELKTTVASNCNRITKVETDIGYIKQATEENKEFMKRADRILSRVERKIDKTDGNHK